MTPRFRARLEADELMDDPVVPVEDLRGALDELERINVALGGYRPSIDGVERLVPPDATTSSVLDVGCGGGDVLRRLVDWARRRGLALRVLAVDLSPTCVDFARERSQGYDEICWAVRDVHALPDGVQFDIAHASLALHHFNGEEARAVLAKLFGLARLGVVVNDLHRHPAAYWSFRALSSLLWRNRLIRHDGPISVLRGFAREELEHLANDIAGAGRWELRWCWPFRWQLVLRKGGA